MPLVAGVLIEGFLRGRGVGEGAPEEILVYFYRKIFKE